MQNDPRVSVLMPAYNAEKYIGEAIESILNQTFKDFEFIIIDDGSKDGTWDAIQKYAKLDERIIASQNTENLGISGTRNALINLSKGKYIVWQDSDDISKPHRIEHQYAFMEAHLGVGMCGGHLQFFSEKGLGGVRKYFPDDGRLRKKIFRYSPVAQPAAIIRKECFKNTGLFPGVSPVADDLTMAFQIGTRYQFANLQEILINYREVETGATYSKLRIMELYTLFLRAKYSKNPSYTFSRYDSFYNAIQCCLVYTVPSNFKIFLFKLLRNGK